MGSFILRGEVWRRMKFQAFLLMVHISQVPVLCIVGHHYNNNLNENVVVLFNNHLYKSYMAQSL